jgi:hypothetical protein
LITLLALLAFNAWLLASGTAAASSEAGGMLHEARVLARMGLEVLMLLLQGVTIAGALRMHSLRGYALARAGAILACIPCLSPCLVLGIPFGAWALGILARPEVREAFTD